MIWENYFSKSILERGREYYDSGLVYNLKYDKGFASGDVFGTRTHLVIMRKKSDGSANFTCSCPYVKNGIYCMHMAAVCYALGDKADELMPDEAPELPVRKQETTQPQSARTMPQPPQSARIMPQPSQSARTMPQPSQPTRPIAQPPRQPQPRAEFFVKPFASKKDSGEYFYYDLAKITEGFTFTEHMVNAAKNLIANNMVMLDNVASFYVGKESGSGEQLRAMGRHIRAGQYTDAIEIDVNAKQILRAVCYVPGCHCRFESQYRYGHQEICVHHLALLMLLSDYIDTHNPGDCTDQGTSQLLSFFEKKRRNEVMGTVLHNRPGLRLEPRVERQWNGLEVSFKLGKEKTYVVKNLTELVENVEKKGHQLFGTQTKVDFSLDRFCEEDKPFYDFVDKVVNRRKEEEQSISKNHPYSVHGGWIKDKIDLSGEKLDDFFEMAKAYGKTISFQDKTQSDKATKLECAEAGPDMNLRIENLFEDGVFQGVRVSGKMPRLIWGKEYAYHLDGNVLNRISGEQKEVLQALENVASRNEVSFVVGRKSLSDFYYHTLPVLKEQMEVVEDNHEQLKEYLPEKAELSFYLDLEDEKLLCKPVAIYGDEEFSLLDLYGDSGDYNIAVRDRNTEEETLFHVQRFFPTADVENKVTYCEDREQFFPVLEESIPEFLTKGDVYCSDAIKKLQQRKRPKLKIGVRMDSGLLNLDVSADGIEKEELLEILRGYRRKEKFYKLKNGDFLNLEDENLKALSSMMDTLQIDDTQFLKENMEIPAYRALYLDKMLEKNDSLYVERDKHYKQLIKEFKTIAESDFEVPKGLNATLRGYQEEGYKWLRTLAEYGFGGILADDMGLGKTLQVITLLQAKKEERIIGTSLVVCPASLVYNWAEEIHRFAPELEVCTVTGTQEEREQIIEYYQTKDVLITSYDLLRRDIAFYEDKSFYYMIIDEAQNIKNHSTAAAKSVKAVNSLYKFALTGTPIENRLSELWSIFDYLMPGYLYDYNRFRDELEAPIVKENDEQEKIRLKKMVSPFVLRRLKQDVLKDLPEKIEKIQYAVFEPEQQQLYDAQVVHMKDMLEGQSESEYSKGKIAVLAELTKLRQICCDPSLLYDNFVGESAKREACMELVKRAMEGEHRILIFSQFTSMLALLEKELQEEGIPYYKITGAVPKEERLQLVKQFNDGDVPVFLISLKAGGTGLNLTGADVVIHYDPWWNVAAQNQATDRAHRIGQDKVVTVYKLIAKKTVEEKIMELQESKKDLADAIITGETNGLAELSKENLLRIL